MDVADETLTLTPICIKDLIVQILKNAGISAKPSKPGRIAERLIHQMKDLEGCRVFKITGARKLIENNKARKGITRGAAKNIIYDETDGGTASFLQHRDLHIEQRNKRYLDTSDVFDFLLKRNIFRTGLTPVCPHCTLDFWLSVDSLHEHCICELCGHQFSIALQLKNRGDWRFRLTGLFGREDHQEGAIPVVLTLLQLYRRQRFMRTFLYSTALELSTRGGVDCESDLVVLSCGNDGSTSILLGECKTNKMIERDDVEKLIRAREEIHKTGINCFLVFSKTTSEFTAAEIDLFKEIHQKNIPTILFTARELEPYEPYANHPDKGALPNPYASAFEEMARNSAFLYLKSTDC
jgi:hypothetical protein